MTTAVRLLVGRKKGRVMKVDKYQAKEMIRLRLAEAALIVAALAMLGCGGKPSEAPQELQSRPQRFMGGPGTDEGTFYRRILSDGEMVAENQTCVHTEDTQGSVLVCRTAASPPPPTDPPPTPTPTPPARQRVGYGAASNGGKGGDVYTVTKLGDAGPGSLRFGVLNRTAPRVIKFAVAGKIKLASGIYIKAPYLTIDGFSAPPPGITVEAASVTTPGLKIVATHDVDVLGIRSQGMWIPGGLNVKNDTAPLGIDGDGTPQVNSWDPTPQRCRQGILPFNARNSCFIYLDGVTLSNSADDGPDIWRGTTDVTITRSLIYDSFQPRGTGSEANETEQSTFARRRITEFANVYVSNGERTPKYSEGVYDADLVNVIVAKWQNDADPTQGDMGYGTQFENDGMLDRFNVVGNVWLPALLVADGASPVCATNDADNRCRIRWDCFWGPKWKNDNETNLKADGLHYKDNVFGPLHNPAECVSTAKGSNPFPRPYTLAVRSTKSSASMEQVLDEAGVLPRTTREQQLVDWVRAALRARLGN